MTALQREFPDFLKTELGDRFLWLVARVVRYSSLGVWKYTEKPASKVIKSKSRFTLFGGKKAICRGSGPDWRARAGARVWSPLPPGLSKESGEKR